MPLGGSACPAVGARPRAAAHGRDDGAHVVAGAAFRLKHTFATPATLPSADARRPQHDLVAVVVRAVCSVEGPCGVAVALRVACAADAAVDVSDAAL